MSDRKRLAAYTEARRREQVGLITTLGTRRLAKAILASLPRDSQEVIAARRVELEQAIYSNKYHARRWRRKQAEREGK
jgi:hypothetical protein